MIELADPGRYGTAPTDALTKVEPLLRPRGEEELLQKSRRRLRRPPK